MHDAPILFYVLVPVVIIWLFLVNTLFRRLKLRHPLKYLEWGEPALFDGDIYRKRVNIGLFKFLAKREFLLLNDAYLTHICNLMRIVLFIFIILFCALFYLLAIDVLPGIGIEM